MECVHDYHSRLRIVFKENSGLPIDINFARVSFKSMFINGLNREPSLAVTRTFAGGETVCAPDSEATYSTHLHFRRQFRKKGN